LFLSEISVIFTRGGHYETPIEGCPNTPLNSGANHRPDSGEEKLVTTYQKAELRTAEVWDRGKTRYKDIRGGFGVFPLNWLQVFQIATTC
jgi:hypothetical protein